MIVSVLPSYINLPVLPFDPWTQEGFSEEQYIRSGAVVLRMLFTESTSLVLGHEVVLFNFCHKEITGIHKDKTVSRTSYNHKRRSNSL